MKYNKKSILIIAVILILICIAGIFGLSRARNTKNISENNLKTSSKIKKDKTDSISGKNNSNKEENKNKTKVESSKVGDSKSTSDTDSKSSETNSNKITTESHSISKGSVNNNGNKKPNRGGSNTSKPSTSSSSNSGESKKTKVWIVDSPAKDAVYESVPQWGERPYWDVRVEANTSLNKRFYDKNEYVAYENMLFSTRSDAELDSYHYYVGTEKYITGYKQVVVTLAQPEQGHWEWR